jgi:hypothetical protein
MEDTKLLTAAKIGMGRDIAWWKKVLHNLADLVNIDDELLPFLHQPEAYLTSSTRAVSTVFGKFFC